MLSEHESESLYRELRALEERLELLEARDSDRPSDVQWDNLMELQAKLVTLEAELRTLRVSSSGPPPARSRAESAALAGAIVAVVELVKQVAALIAQP